MSISKLPNAAGDSVQPPFPLGSGTRANDLGGSLVAGTARLLQQRLELVEDLWKTVLKKIYLVAFSF